LGRVLQVHQQNRNADTETLELKLGEAILKEMPRLQRGILFIKIISVVAPLLGLLGTVIGMIITFQAITLYGTGDPRIMAGGISTALMTTVLGLVVAIPMVLLHTFVNGRSRRIIQVLQEQSAGIVAEQAEKVRRGTGFRLRAGTGQLMMLNKSQCHRGPAGNRRAACESGVRIMQVMIDAFEAIRDFLEAWRTGVASDCGDDPDHVDPDPGTTDLLPYRTAAADQGSVCRMGIATGRGSHGRHIRSARR
jgi:hypothetical protein